MTQIDYLNVDMNKLIELIRKDTSNYKNLKTSLCGRAFELENRTLVADKIDIEKLTNLIDKENYEFQEKLKKIEKENKGFSLFSGKMKKSKQIKEATKLHEDKLMILNSRLNKRRQQYEENRILLQEIIDKLSTRGIIWHHARKIIAKKIKEGSVEKPKATTVKPVKVDKTEDIKKTGVIGTKINIEETEDDTNKTFKEKNFFNVDETYRILGLTPEEFREYQIILQYIMHNREMLKDTQLSLKLRMALALDGHLGKFKNLALYASDFALYNDIYKYCSMNDGADYANNFKRFMTAKINNDRMEIGRMDKFFRLEAMNIMQNSGFETEFIQRNYGAFEKEIRELYSSPGEMRKIIDRMNYPAQSYQQMHLAFQELEKQEITYRLRTKDMNQPINLQTNIREPGKTQGILDILLDSNNDYNSIHPLDEYHDHHDDNYYDHLVYHEYNKDHHHHHGKHGHHHGPHRFKDDRQTLFDAFESGLDEYNSQTGYYADNYDDDIVDTDTTDDNDTGDDNKLEDEQSYYND